MPNRVVAVVSGGPVIVTLGPTLSNRTVYPGEVLFPTLLALSATPVGTEIVTSSSTLSAGSISAVYVVPLPENDFTVALTLSPSEMSLAVKPVTASLKVIVIVNGLFCGVVGTSVMTTVGPVTVTGTVCVDDALLPLSESSMTTLAGTEISKSPAVLGVTVAV